MSNTVSSTRLTRQILPLLLLLLVLSTRWGTSHAWNCHVQVATQDYHSNTGAQIKATTYNQNDSSCSAAAQRADIYNGNFVTLGCNGDSHCKLAFYYDGPYTVTGTEKEWMSKPNGFHLCDGLTEGGKCSGKTINAACGGKFYLNYAEKEICTTDGQRNSEGGILGNCQNCTPGTSGLRQLVGELIPVVEEGHGNLRSGEVVS